MEVEVPDADAVAFRLLLMSASIFFRKGSSRRKAAAKIRIRITEIAAPIQRTDLRSTSLLKYESTFLRMNAMDHIGDCR